jgi:Ca2+-binding EF-hand superfamily protein
MNVSSFRELLDIFNANSNSRGEMDSNEFTQSFSENMLFNAAQMESLFMKIDTDLNGIISWDDFSNYMLLRAEGEKNMKEDAESQLFHLDQV